MHVLVTGAYGLIGSAVLARLHRDGHRLTGAGRTLAEARRRFPYAQWIEADFVRLDTPDTWRPLLVGIDAVVNCVGVLQDGAGDNVTRVQVEGTVALFDACAAAGIRHVVHVSAIGAAADAPTPFIRTKAQADAHLASLDLDWTILRPALVLAPTAYGGTAMLRALAAFPGVTPIVGADSPMQVVSVDDIAETVSLCLRKGAAAKAAWNLAHPQVHTLGDIVAALRQWHGFPPRPAAAHCRNSRSRSSRCLRRSLAGSGGAARRAGPHWPSSRGAVGDPAAWMRATGIEPRSLDDILAERPASVQDRWFARLYLLKPLAIFSLALFWILTGAIALGPGRTAAIAQMTGVGFSAPMAELTVVLGSLIDIALGLLVCIRKFARIALLLMLFVTLAYLVAGTILTPQLWVDPLGPLLKIVPHIDCDAVHACHRRRPMTDLIFTLKLVHVLGATVLFGTGLGIAFFMLMAHRTGDPATIAQTARVVVIADALFTASAVIAQPISGGLLAWAMGYSPWESWIVVSLVLYVLRRAVLAAGGVDSGRAAQSGA